VGRRDLPDDREPQSGSPGLAVAGFLQPHEPVEDPCAVARRDSWPVVIDYQLDEPFRLLEGKGDGAAGVTDRVLGEVANYTSAAAAASGVSHSRCPLPRFGPGAQYHPVIHPEDFRPDVTNKLFPLKVGRILIYTGVKDGKRALNISVTTNRTRKVDHVLTRVVEDRLYLNGVLEERTSDYYAQDRCGNVWYFGEDTATLDAKGHVVSTEGSFHAGVDGAQPGVFMQARPELGRWFRQEWFAGHAEDRFKAIDKNSKITVPAGTFRHALRTAERTHLEPDVVDNKYLGIRRRRQRTQGSATPRRDHQVNQPTDQWAGISRRYWRVAGSQVLQVSLPNSYWNHLGTKTLVPTGQGLGQTA
jgi:hypothetical protein